MKTSCAHIEGGAPTLYKESPPSSGTGKIPFFPTNYLITPTFYLPNSPRPALHRAGRSPAFLYNPTRPALRGSAAALGKNRLHDSVVRYIINKISLQRDGNARMLKRLA